MYRANVMPLDEVKASNAELDCHKGVAQTELEDLQNVDAWIRELEALPQLVDDYLATYRT
jgi:hypothetical protein